MTGFGGADGVVAGRTIRFEIRAVNAKGLDIRFRLPPGVDHLDTAMRESARNVLGRGTIHISCELSDAARGVAINREVLAFFCEEARKLEDQGFAPATADGLLSLRGVLENGEHRLPSEDEARSQNDPVILGFFEDALRALVASRREEGKRLQTVIADQVSRIASLAMDAEADPSRSAEAVSLRLARQVSQLLDASSALDPARLNAEAALLATRADVREELDRLSAHCAAIRDLFQAEEPVGRRLDFLAQELGRESNTLCAKSNAPALTAIGLDMKVVVDQLREQVQNVE